MAPGIVRHQAPVHRGLTMANHGPLFPRLLAERSTRWFLLTLAALAIVMPLLILLVPADAPFHASAYTITLLGTYLSYALLALAVDLIWGYCGILSLGHGIGRAHV